MNRRKNFSFNKKDCENFANTPLSIIQEEARRLNISTTKAGKTKSVINRSKKELCKDILNYKLGSRSPLKQVGSIVKVPKKVQRDYKPVPKKIKGDFSAIENLFANRQKQLSPKKRNPTPKKKTPSPKKKFSPKKRNPSPKKNLQQQLRMGILQRRRALAGDSPDSPSPNSSFGSYNNVSPVTPVKKQSSQQVSNVDLKSALERQMGFKPKAKNSSPKVKPGKLNKAKFGDVNKMLLKRQGKYNSPVKKQINLNPKKLNQNYSNIENMLKGKMGVVKPKKPSVKVGKIKGDFSKVENLFRNKNKSKPKPKSKASTTRTPPPVPPRNKGRFISKRAPPPVPSRKRRSKPLPKLPSETQEQAFRRIRKKPLPKLPKKGTPKYKKMLRKLFKDIPDATSPDRKRRKLYKVPTPKKK